MFYNRLISFIKDYYIICKSQYGFPENHSTSPAIIEHFEDITNTSDNNLITTAMFIDLKKVLDTINHSILVKKLSHYGIRGIACKWIENDLHNRSQYVVYNGVASEYQNMVCGILQGSILGPIIFLLYVNDLANISTK